MKARSLSWPMTRKQQHGGHVELRDVVVACIRVLVECISHSNYNSRAGARPNMRMLANANRCASKQSRKPSVTRIVGPTTFSRATNPRPSITSHFMHKTMSALLSGELTGFLAKATN
jgi:hypothetical protein